jgi:hypothetical protein
MILLVGGLTLSPSMALAQDTTAPATTNSPATNTPATDAIGPRELQGFSLPGTKTQTASPAPAPATTTPPPTARTEEAASVANAPQRQRTQRAPTTRAAPAQSVTASAPATFQPTPAIAGPPQTPAVSVPSQTIVSAAAAPDPAPATLAPRDRLSFLPWLIAALALAGGIAFLLWHRRPREAYAGGPEFDLFVPSEPVTPPRPAPQPAAGPDEPALPPVPALPKPKPAASSGIVASRLRPSLEIGVQPMRCIVDEDRVVIEFELDVFNAGAAPARAVLAEASLFNPGATQEQELGAFFANPVGVGNRIDAIAPMKRITLTSQVVAPRASIQEYDVGGRKSFVPVIAFNTLYEWSGGKGQTSASYLVGRETGHDKLGPLHLDKGMREFRAVGARPLPSVLRT